MESMAFPSRHWFSAVKPDSPSRSRRHAAMVNQIYRYATQGDALNKQTYNNGGSGINAPTMGSMVDTIL